MGRGSTEVTQDMPTSISTIIPTRNRATLLARAIDSVLAASRPGDELIVVDDGSTDDTTAILARYAGRVRTIVTPGLGAGAARNVGVAEASHAFIAFLDSDDEWMRDRLEIGRRLLDARPDIVFCFSDFGVRVPGEPERHHAVVEWFRREPVWEHDLGAPILYSSVASLPEGRSDFQVFVGDLTPSLVDACPVAVQTMLVRRDLAGKALRFADDLPTYEDWECVVRLARVGKAAFLDCETAWQHGHPTPRITDLHRDPYIPATAHMKLLTRQLLSDELFMANHGNRVRAALQQESLRAAKSLLRRGETRAARSYLRSVNIRNGPYTLLALLPEAVMRRIVVGYDWLRSSLKSVA